MRAITNICWFLVEIAERKEHQGYGLSLLLCSCFTVVMILFPLNDYEHAGGQMRVNEGHSIDHP